MTFRSSFSGVPCGQSALRAGPVPRPRARKGGRLDSARVGGPLPPDGSPGGGGGRERPFRSLVGGADLPALARALIGFWLWRDASPVSLGQEPAPHSGWVSAHAAPRLRRRIEGIRLDSRTMAGTPRHRREREFGLLVGGVLCLLGGWWLYRGRSGAFPPSCSPSAPCSCSPARSSPRFCAVRHRGVDGAGRGPVRSS